MLSLVWSSQAEPPEVPSPLAIDGLLYLLEGSGCTLAVLRVADGRKVLAHSLKERGTPSYYASPVAVAGRVYALRADGTTVVFRIARRGATYAYEELGRGRLVGQRGCWASPAVADGKVYVGCMNFFFFCLGETDGTGPS